MAAEGRAAGAYWCKSTGATSWAKGSHANVSPDAGQVFALADYSNAATKGMDANNHPPQAQDYCPRLSRMAVPWLSSNPCSSKGADQVRVVVFSLSVHASPHLHQALSLITDPSVWSLLLCL